MESNEAQEHDPIFVLELDFSGTLIVDDRSQAVSGKVTVAWDGTIRVTFGPIPFLKESSWLLDLTEGKGRMARWVTLDASSDAMSLHTEHLTITSHTPRLAPGGDSTIDLGGEASTLMLRYVADPATSANCALRYRTIGMRGFSQQHAVTDFGEIFLAGLSKIDNYDDIAGRVIVKATQTTPLNEWVSHVDERLEHILRVVALADGKPLFWSIRELFHEKTCVRAEFYGPRHTGNPEDNVFHFLNLKPVLDLAVQKYTPELREKTGIGLAINLFLSHPPHLELRLITAMTALEHLVSVYHKHHSVQPPLDKETFSTLKKALFKTWDEAAATLSSDSGLSRRLARVRDRIGNLNQPTFKDRLWPMLRDYNVPLVGIEDRINPAIDARNDIVHTGLHDAPFEAFYLHVAVLRELLKRIFLTLLGYQGQYQSYLNGPEWLAFPPMDTKIVE